VKHLEVVELEELAADVANNRIGGTDEALEVDRTRAADARLRQRPRRRKAEIGRIGAATGAMARAVANMSERVCPI
jgi:hypothetical protein